MEILRGRPGINQSRVCEEMGLSWSTTKYHLKRLEREGAVHLERYGRRDIRCFPVSIPAKYRPWLATLLDTTVQDLLRELGPGESGVVELSRRIGLSESATRRRLEHLREVGLVRKRGKLRPRYAPSGESVGAAPTAAQGSRK